MMGEESQVNPIRNYSTGTCAFDTCYASYAEGRSISQPGVARRVRSGLIDQKAVVGSIEHGFGLDAELMERMVRQETYWCPTIYVGIYVAEGSAAAGAPIWLTMRDLEAKAFGLAVRKGVKIVYGTDAGGYAWTENQAKEFAYMGVTG